MKTIFSLFIIILLISSCEKGEDIQPSIYNCDFDFADSSDANPNKVEYQELLHSITGNGVVGITMSVYHSDYGIWNGASGKSDLHNSIAMKSCDISRVGSTVKMYTATTILLLHEEGKIDIDHKISSYLNGDNIDRIENADKATIRQLLQHSSGIYNYIQNLKFQTASLNDLLKEWNADDLLKYAYNKSATFQPDEDVAYSNTNYILLGLLIEKIEGKPLYQVFDEKLFIPLDLTLTQFAGKDHVPDNIARGYIDLYSNLQVIESTYYSGWDYHTADGGLISNPHDMSVFFRALMNEEIVNSHSLNEMLTFKTPKTMDPDFFPIYYGLGIFKIETSQGLAYMHSGDAIGYYANMIYFPEDHTTVVYAVNSNYGKIDELVSTKTAMEYILSVTKE